MTDKQITPEEFDTLTDDQIVTARRLGQLDTITGVRTQLSRADLQGMSPEAITAASERGALATLTGARAPKVNPGQGGTAPHAVLPLAQLDREDLRAMSAEAIIAAQAAGQTDNLLGKPPRPVIDPPRP